ncbi:MAG: hypothetical protein HKO56_03920 [Bacteroidia bacterium]|nr:hypothetical protein [Bacteroidia bacterium]NNC86096.1 hypothetical protein [Bacteroidia bacterium]NNM15784.1 hypothetical protein [Bacteroidia bacterium]
MKSKYKYLLLFFALAIVGYFLKANNPSKSKINGINFVASVNEMPSHCIAALSNVSANYVAFNPFAYSMSGETYVKYDNPRQWWGEKTQGTITCMQYAKDHQIDVMIKPHVWVRKEGWPEHFKVDNEEEWVEWEKNYSEYILTFAKIAEQHHSKIFCVGTEFGNAVKERPAFWGKLIDDVRKVYSGKLTYAANWDSYQDFPHWYKLDYIGIDAYFPLSESETPSVEELKEAWKKPFSEIDAFQTKMHKPILFTEYGYRSIDKTAWKQWELPDDWRYDGEDNPEAQLNAYKALYQTFWDKPWFAGGFLWKWYDEHAESGGENNNDYTPQNKPVQFLINKTYQENN